MKDTKAVKVWSHEYLLKNYGDVELYGMDYSKNQATESNIGFGDAAKKNNRQICFGKSTKSKIQEKLFISIILLIFLIRIQNY